MINIFYILLALAIVIMIGGLTMAIRLKKIASGGTIGNVVNVIIALVVLFFMGYLASIFMPALSKEITLIFAGMIFFFGAIFVVLVLQLITRLVKNVMEAIES